MMPSYRPLTWCLITGAMLLATACTKPPASLAGQAGFVEAWFDASSLNSILADNTCTHIRFYNARRVFDDTKGTCIAIGVKADGSPIYNGTTWKYRMHDRVTSGTTPMALLTDLQAKAKIQFVKDAGENKYAVNFSRADIVNLLTSAGCQGIRLFPERTATGMYSMVMHPAKLAGSGGTINPAPPSVMCTEPCPNYCGSYPAYYIHLP